ncbi:WD domain protein [Sclerotinia borealis F-4128]|uniref:WD domain protein n=1 Tax=Sclerotinia borealis (strain F-4128) TaxID=1432307 RepID=W9CP43_SCLBF|nr:WD domain protein [Sclerotinia borealis F-4128]
MASLINHPLSSGTPADFVLADETPHRQISSLSNPDDPSTPTSHPRSTNTASSAQPILLPYQYAIEQSDSLPTSSRDIIEPLRRAGTRTRSTPQAELRPRRTPAEVLGRRRRDYTLDRGEQSNTPPSPGDSSNPSNPEIEHRHKRQRQSATMRFDGESSNSNGNSRSVSNGAGPSPLHKAAPINSANGAHSLSLAMNGSSTNGHSDSGIKPVSTYFGHDREEVTRILIQALTDLGYNGAAGTLSQESGYDLESPTVAAFRNAVLQGEWTEAEELLFGGSTEKIAVNIYGNGLALRDGVDKNFMRFWMRQQKFLELLEQKDMGRAINVLRSELTPLYQDTAKLHFLSSLLMCTPEDLKVKANWDGATGISRQLLLSQLSKCISPSAMLPENRLATLFNQVKQHQISTCIYHNTYASPSLYKDHTCDRSNFPLRPVVELDKHSGEIWDTKFSHDGTLLASCGSDGVVVVYNVPDFDVHVVLSEHEAGVCSFAWSPDDTRMVTCGRDNRACLWNTATGELLKTLPRFSEPVTCCVWTPDGKSFIIGSLAINKNLCQWSLDGDIIYDWARDHRIRDIAVTRNGSRLAAIEQLTHLYVYNFGTRELEYELDLKVQLCSVSISQNSRHLLVHCCTGETRMLDIETGETVRSFVSGDKGGEFIIRSSFGGANESFVVSGSEEGNVVIYHRENGTVVEKLEGHKKGCCNAISWNPTNPAMFASAGDDGKIRIWSSENTQGGFPKSVALNVSNGSQREPNGW